MASDVRYIDRSGQALVELMAQLAPLAERAAEIIVEEIQKEIDASTPAGRFYYLPRPFNERRSDERAARREFELAQHQAKESGGPAAKRRRVPRLRKYQASAPGQPPAKPTLRYRNSWRSTAAGRRGAKVSALAYSKAKMVDGSSLAAALEYGKGRLKPRPHIGAALQRARTRIAALTGGKAVAA